MKRFLTLLASTLLTLTAGVALAQVKISDLPAAVALTGTEIVPLVQGGDTERTTTAAIAALAGGGLTLASGTYTPTCTPSPSIMSACTGQLSHYIRVGNQVHFSVWFNATSNQNQLGQGNITLPVASAFATSTDATGACGGYTNTTASAGRIEADAAADNLRVFINSSVAAGGPWTCSGTYTVI